MTLAHLEVVEIVGRGDFDRPGALLRIGVFVGDDGDQTPDDGQAHALADQGLVALIGGVNSHGCIAEHGLGPRRGDHHLAGTVLQRIGEMPIVAIDRLLFDLEVGDGGLELRIPVDQPLVAIDQPFLVELNEDLADRGREAVVEGEPLAAPVAGGAQPAQLVDDGPAGLGLPFPDLVDEGLAAHVAAPDIALLGQLALDHHLGGDAGVVGAWQPQGRLPLHAVEPGQDVLQGVIQRMADVQRAGDVRRRDDHGEARRIGAFARRERPRGLPLGIEARLDGLGIEGLFKHGWAWV